MPVGTSLGQLFDDDFHYFQNQHDPDKFPSTGELKPPETPDSNVLTPKGLEGNKNQATDPDLEIPITQRLDVYRTNPPEMPPGAPTEVTGAFKSSEATQVAPSTNASPGASNDLSSSIPDFTNKSGLSQLGDDIFGSGEHDIRPALGSMLEQGKNALALPGDVLSGKVEPGSIQEIERATDLAGLMVGGPAPVASKMADGTLGSFAGVKSATAPTMELKTAQGLAEEGINPDIIWQHTGWMKDTRDGKWKYEINDQGMNIKKDFDLNKTQESTLGEVVDHPELFKAYPHLKDISLTIDHQLNKLGSAGAAGITINPSKVNSGKQGVLDILTHEIQHVIQRHEGFQTGSTVARAFDDTRDALANKINKLDENSSELPALQKLYGELTTAKQKMSYYLYSRVPGEVEANLSVARRHLDEQQRLNFTPNDTMDILEGSTNSLSKATYRKPIDIPFRSSAAASMEGPETISSAAMKLNGELFTAENHAVAIDKYFEKYGHSNKWPKGWEDGFMTSKGRFVSREEAMDIAKQSNQVNNRQRATGLLSEDLL